MTLLPHELINNSLDAYIAKHNTKSQMIYWVVLIAITGAIVSLPFIHVDISVRDVGVIRPIIEKTEIKSTITEYVDSVYVKEGEKVNKGDTLLVFRSVTPDYKINYRQSRITDLRNHINDLNLLTKGLKPESFYSDTRRQEYNYFLKQETEYETYLDKASRNYERNKSLYEQSVISTEEFEVYQFEYTKAVNQLASLRDNQIGKWQTDLDSYRNLYNEIQSDLDVEMKGKDFYVITSPVEGTIEQFRGIYKGSNVQAGAVLAVISPDSTLYAEVYVSPRNIGYINAGMPVHLQVESFNYNEWGTLPGQVAEISSDYFADNENKVFYKVKCSLGKDYLLHKRGSKGLLKKGMSVSAHFLIARRSLLDLIYQKMDTWINPTQYNASS
jgi:multidrug resistance efflux pump